MMVSRGSSDVNTCLFDMNCGPQIQLPTDWASLLMFLFNASWTHKLQRSRSHHCNIQFQIQNRRKKIPSELLMSKTATLASKYLLTLNTVNGPYLNLPGNHLNLTLIKELNYKLVIITQNLLETKLKILHKRVSHQKRDTQ